MKPSIANKLAQLAERLDEVNSLLSSDGAASATPRARASAVLSRRTVRKALAAARFDSVRGAFKFNTNQFPIQDYYLRVITRDTQGRITNRMLGKVFEKHGDAYVGDCKMPADL